MTDSEKEGGGGGCDEKDIIKTRYINMELLILSLSLSLSLSFKYLSLFFLF